MADDESNVELNLCELLGIDVESIAYNLAMESDTQSEEISEHTRNFEDNAMRIKSLINLSEDVSTQ